MDMNDLQRFLTVAEYGNISKAADALYLSKQTISNTISKLEAELDVILFDRTISGVSLTQDGNILKAHAHRLISEFENLKNDFSGKSSQKKTVKLATTTGVFCYLTLDFLDEFYSMHPNIEVQIIELLDPQIDELLWNEEIDMAFNSEPTNYFKFDAYLFSSHKYLCILNNKHPLAKHNTIKYSDLAGFPLAIQRSFNYHMHKLMQEGFTPNIVFETIYPGLLNEFANYDRNIVSIGTDYTSIQNLKKNQVVRPFEDETCTWNNLLITKKGRKLSSEAELFYQYCVEWSKKHEASK